jgi:putative ABC transport system permease protein
MIPIRYNARSLTVRKATTVATAAGIALVVWVLASTLMLTAGIKKTLATSGRSDTAIVLRKGSDSELASVIDEATTKVILASPGIARNASGKPLGVAENVVVGLMEKLGANGFSNVQMRGVPDDATAFRPEVQVVEGRRPQPGSDEVMIGRQIRGRFRGVDLDESFDLRKNRTVKVVGVFTAAGSSYESEVWVDRETMRDDYGRGSTASAVRVRLDSPAAFDSFKDYIESDKRLGLQAMRETDYYERQSENTGKLIGVLGTLTAVFASLGAMIGAAITMYAAVANRRREIGTLRALGFSRAAILVSFLIESIILSLAGGAVGTAASTAMALYHPSMLNQASWSEIVFSFDPTPQVLARALVFAALMGLLGGFLPALRASRVSPVAAMRG